MTTPTPNRIPVNIEDEMKRSYMDYAMSVIIGRALPDVRDGLKPAHRRVLYGMKSMGLTSTRGYRKCAKIVGEVMGNFHPHGDASIYDTLVRLAQDFNMRYVLTDGQGNFGSIDGDPPAAMRYTEARLDGLADEMMVDLDKETVDFVPNYDETTEEPTVLPAPFPNLLVNGSAGIAVGMATNIPPHNMREVIEASIWLIESAQSDVKPTLPEKQRKLLELVPGPDFPTGGYIVGRLGIQQAYLTGRGMVTMRAKAEIELSKKGDRQSIVIEAIPYQVNKARLIERIAELVREKVLEGISDIRDESDRDGMRVVIDLKRGEVGEVVLNNLYKHTQLQTTFGINTLAIVGGRPQVLSLLDVLNNFIEFRREIVPEPQRANRPHSGRVEDCARSPRCGDRVDSCLLESECGARGPHHPVWSVADPGAGHSRYATAAADRSRARKDSQRASRAAEADRTTARHPEQRQARHADRR